MISDEPQPCLEQCEARMQRPMDRKGEHVEGEKSQLQVCLQ